MHPSYRPAWEFLRSAAHAKTLDQLHEKFSAALEPFGFDRFSCAQAQSAAGAPNNPRVLFGTSDETWDELYEICLEQALHSSAPFALSDISDRLPLKTAARLFENGAVFTVSLPGENGALFLVRLKCSSSTFDLEARSVLSTLALTFCVQGLRITDQLTIPDDAVRSPLSRRETDCLLWVTEGKSDWDIAEILNISQWTVHEHIERAKEKLGVRSRTQAALRAMSAITNSADRLPIRSEDEWSKFRVLN